MLGICYGHQLIASELGGTVAPTGGGEYGKTDLRVTAKSVLFEELPDALEVWMSHGDAVTMPPPGFVSVATSAGAAGGGHGGQPTAAARGPVPS